MGDDEYHPISRAGTNLTNAGGVGYTVVDSIDTMLLMGLTEEYQRAREWVATNMTLDRDADFNTFEVRFILPHLIILSDRTYASFCRPQYAYSADSSRLTNSPKIQFSSNEPRNLPTVCFPYSTPHRGYHFQW
jgi:Glycosyl hydrolase family 47